MRFLQDEDCHYSVPSFRYISLNSITAFSYEANARLLPSAAGMRLSSHISFEPFLYLSFSSHIKTLCIPAGS